MYIQANEARMPQLKEGCSLHGRPPDLSDTFDEALADLTGMPRRRGRHKRQLLPGRSRSTSQRQKCAYDGERLHALHDQDRTTHPKELEKLEKEAGKNRNLHTVESKVTTDEHKLTQIRKLRKTIK